MDVVSLALLLLILTFVWFIYATKKPKRPLPGPRGYPIIGRTLEINSKNIHYKLCEWAKQYGNIFQVNLFGTNVVVLNSLDVVRNALLKEPNATIFANRVPNSGVDDFTYGRSDIGLGSYSEKWLKRRKLGHKIIKDFNTSSKEIDDSVKAQLNLTVSKIKAINGMNFDPESIIEEFLWETMAILITGRQHGMDSEWIKATKDFDRVKDELFQPITTFLLHLCPFVRRTPGPISRLYRKCKSHQKKLEKLTRLEQLNNGNKGVLHYLYDEWYEEIKMGNNDPWLTEESIFAIVTDLMNGGIVTSKSSLWSTIHILLHRKDVQNKLQEEIDRVIGQGRLPTISDKSNMPYTKACILEILRFTTPFPILVPHFVSRDTELDGFDIPEGSIVLVNVWNIHNDEAAFPEPDKFKPERFLDEEGKLFSANSQQRRHFMSFGTGKRSCIGESFARNRLFLFIATLMQNFTFLPDENSHTAIFDPSDMDICMMLMRMPKRFICRAKSRHAKEESRDNEFKLHVSC